MALEEGGCNGDGSHIAGSTRINRTSFILTSVR